MKRESLFPVFFYAVLLLVLLGGWYILRSKLEPVLSPQEQQEVDELKKFRAQSKKDHLVLLSDNSFFGPSLKPLAGQPVLLAAGVEQWDGAVDDESGESGDRVEFEVVQGNAKLAFFLDLRNGKALSIAQTRLQAPALGSYEAFVWLLTPPGETGEVVVRARLLPQGERAVFMDPQPLLFHIHPVLLPKGVHIPSAKTLAAKSFQGDRAPHMEVLERDIFLYPGGQGVFTSDLKGYWYGPGQARIFQADPSGKVQELSSKEEKSGWSESRERWHRALDPQGVLTHLDGTGKKWGFLSYAEDKSFEPSMDGFRPEKWTFQQYRSLMPEAGPEDQVTLTSFKEDPEKPVEIQIKRVHRSVPLASPAGTVWGRTLAWTSEVANIEHVYSIIQEERRSFQSGIVPFHLAVDGLTRVLAQNQLKGPVRQMAWEKAGCSFQDFDASLEPNYHEFGHPPGLVVGSVKTDGPVALAGLKAGDILVLADWQRMRSTADAEKVFTAPEPEGGWSLLYWRKGVYHQLWVQTP